MDLSILLAKMFGAAYLVMGIAILMHMEHHKKMFADLMKNGSIVFLMGIFAVVTGVAMIHAHSVWEASWRVVITIIGWIAFIKGVLLLLFPRWIRIFENWFASKDFLTFVGICAIIFGAIMCFFAFGYNAYLL